MKGPKADAILEFLQEIGFRISSARRKDGTVIETSLHRIKFLTMEKATSIEFDMSVKNTDASWSCYWMSLGSYEEEGDARIVAGNHYVYMRHCDFLLMCLLTNESGHGEAWRREEDRINRRIDSLRRCRETDELCYLFRSATAADKRGSVTLHSKGRGNVNYTLKCQSMDGYDKDSPFSKDQVFVASMTENEFLKCEEGSGITQPKYDLAQFAADLNCDMEVLASFP